MPASQTTAHMVPSRVVTCAEDVPDSVTAAPAALVKVNDPRARLSALVGRTNLHSADRSGYALSIAFVGWLRERLGAGGLQGLTRLYLAARRRPLEEALGVADIEAAEVLWWRWLGASSRAVVEAPDGVTR